MIKSKKNYSRDILLTRDILLAPTVAVVTPRPVLDMAELARAQEGCQESQELRAKLAAQDVLIISHKMWCDNSLGLLRPLLPSLQQRAQPGPPGHTCNQVHADQQVCLD